MQNNQCQEHVALMSVHPRSFRSPGIHVEQCSECVLLVRQGTRCLSPAMPPHATDLGMVSTSP